ncbi:transporter [Shewanella sp. SNU WT4]|uniref:FUSC family membrane protein n=1 Tax=Shewanella sp. SNU WT4 TaxID=2590015 RepID=UPI00112E0635|nr:FUSC family membrane protein [Shewanella sp. SNU WT4]QDF66119.1 transporter [Shewanella sp. SNU WT4]
MLKFRDWLSSFKQPALWRYSMNIRANVAALSFISCSLPLFYINQVTLGIAASLGSIACGLADSATLMRHRYRDISLAIVVFFFAALAVTLLFPHTLVFVAYLAVSSFGLLMLAALSPRLGALGFASILLGIYAMILYSAKQAPWHIPLMLALGALWYGLWQGLATLVFPHQQDKDLLFDVYRQLAKKYQAHAAPLLEHPSQQTHAKLGSSVISLGPKVFIDTAKARSRFTQSFNELSHRLYQKMSAGEINLALTQLQSQLDLAAMLAEHSRLLDFIPSIEFKSQYPVQLAQMHKACSAIADYISRGATHDKRPLEAIDIHGLQLWAARQQAALINAQLNPQAMADLQAELQLAKKFIEQLALIINLLTQREPRANYHTPSHYQPQVSSNGWQNQWQKFIHQCHWQSNVFRHAIRGALCLASGLILVRAFDLEFGFWTLMTSLLVLKPNVAMTWKRFLDRFIGTMAGLLLVAVMLKWQAPMGLLPWVFCLAATLFFHTSARHYAVAVCCVTLFVFCGFSLNGEGDIILLPRLENTLLGILLPLVWVIIIAPGWHKHDFPKQLHLTLVGYQQLLTQLQGMLDASDNNQQAQLTASLNTCVSNDVNLFDLWQGYLAEPNRNTRITESMLVCSYSSNLMLRLLTRLQSRAHELTSAEGRKELQATISLIAKAETRLAHLSKSRLFYPYIARHQQQVHGQLEAMIKQGDLNALALLKLLQAEITSFTLLHPAKNRA